MHGRKGRYRNKRRGLRVNCFCAFGNNVQAFSSSLPRTSKRYSARVSTVGVSKGVNGGVPILELSSPENCPSSVEFPDTLFRYFENFSPFETVTDRGNAVSSREIERTFNDGKGFLAFARTFRSRARSLRFPRGESLSSGPCCLNASLLETGYEYSFCRVLFRGERCSRFLHDDFQWIFRLPISG